MLMDADNVILLAQCLSNRYMPVCSFTFVFFRSGQRSKVMECKNCLIS